MTNSKSVAIILAAGEGTRMKSDTPKVLHQLAGMSMLGHVIEAAKKSGLDQRIVVIGPDMDKVAELVSKADEDAGIAIQEKILGTGHAVMQAQDFLTGDEDAVLVLYGDTPLITPETLKRITGSLGNSDIVVLGFDADDPSGYGRLIEEAGELHKIVEHADASDEELKVTLCNSGVMAFRGANLAELLGRIGNKNKKGEYYLTDAIEIARSMGLKCAVIEADEDEVLGINSRNELAGGEKIIQDRLRKAAMDEGATLIDPDSVWFCHDTRLGRDVVIEPHVIFGPGVSIGDNVRINGFCHIEQASIGDGALIGPFARLRPGADIGQSAKVGNFVEIKKSRIDTGAKVSHLSYIGDAVIGANANIGAGTITCNYDGYSKFTTKIGKGAFIGSNSSLVAPVSIGDGAYIGSGSVITKDVAAGSLAIARGRQVEKPGWAAGLDKRKKG